MLGTSLGRGIAARSQRVEAERKKLEKRRRKQKQQSPPPALQTSKVDDAKTKKCELCVPFALMGKCRRSAKKCHFLHLVECICNRELLEAAAAAAAAAALAGSDTHASSGAVLSGKLARLRRDAGFAAFLKHPSVSRERLQSLFAAASATLSQMDNGQDSVPAPGDDLSSERLAVELYKCLRDTDRLRERERRRRKRENAKKAKLKSNQQSTMQALDNAQTAQDSSKLPGSKDKITQQVEVEEAAVPTGAAAKRSEKAASETPDSKLQPSTARETAINSKKDDTLNASESQQSVGAGLDESQNADAGDTNSVKGNQRKKSKKGAVDIQRYRKLKRKLWSKWDEGILMPDPESWFSCCPEAEAIAIARCCTAMLPASTTTAVEGQESTHSSGSSSSTTRVVRILDAFCGVGGNAVRFAKVGNSVAVVGTDIDASKLAAAKHNAGIYGALRNLEFVVADFFAAAVPTFLPPLGSARGKPFDVVYLAPPWGGVNYKHSPDGWDVDMPWMQPAGLNKPDTLQSTRQSGQTKADRGLTAMLARSLQLGHNACMFLPRNVNISRVKQCWWKAFMQADPAGRNASERVLTGNNFNDSILFTEHIMVYGRPNPLNRSNERVVAISVFCGFELVRAVRPLYCPDCKKFTTSEKQMAQHLSGKKHRLVVSHKKGSSRKTNDNTKRVSKGPSAHASKSAAVDPSPLKSTNSQVDSAKPDAEKKAPAAPKHVGKQRKRKADQSDTESVADKGIEKSQFPTTTKQPDTANALGRKKRARHQNKKRKSKHGHATADNV